VQHWSNGTHTGDFNMGMYNIVLKLIDATTLNLEKNGIVDQR